MKEIIVPINAKFTMYIVQAFNPSEIIVIVSLTIMNVAYLLEKPECVAFGIDRMIEGVVIFTVKVCFSHSICNWHFVLLAFIFIVL